MNISTSNNLAFQAKLDVSGLSKKSDKLNSIVKNFEKKSSKYPNAKLELYDNCVAYTNTKMDKEGCYGYLKEDLNELLDNTPISKIVNSLLKYLKMSSAVFHTLEKAEKFGKTCEKLDAKINDDSEENVFDAVYSSALDLVYRYIKSETNKDDLLKHWEIHA